MFPLPSTDKRSLRRSARKQTTTIDWEAISPRVAAQVATLSEFASARHVLLYLATDREICVEGLARQFTDKSWYVPRCIENGDLTIHPFRPDETPLIRGAFDLREPDAAQVSAALPNVLDMVLVPGVLFTAEGDRLGHGGGYYDRFLPRLSPECLRVGVACEAMLAYTLPRDPWDARVDVVVTETRLFRPLLHVPFSKTETAADKDAETL